MGKGFHCLAIKTDGTLWSWGANGYGQLGVNSTIDSNIPEQVDSATDWQWIEDNVRMSFAGKTDGSLWGWGTSSASGSPIGLSYNLQPLHIGFATDWKSLSLEVYDNNDYAMLLKTNGTLWAWGRDSSEQLGNGIGNLPYSAPTQIGTDENWITAVAGNAQASAVKSDGTFWVWGDTALIGDGNTNIAVPTNYGQNCMLGTDHKMRDEINFYPNPVKYKIFIEGIKDAKISVVGVDGRAYQSFYKNGIVDVSNLSAGIYILLVQKGDTVQTKQFIKE